MSVDSSAMLINGLRTEFTKTYRDALNRQSDGRLAMVMDLDGVGATNREHDFGYREAAPHIERWVRGNAIPTEGMASKTYKVVVHNWGKRCEWHEDDREDDQTGSLMQDVAQLGDSAGLLAERFFFDLLLGQTNTLPVTINAPDGNSLFISSARFEYSSGNTVASFSANSTQDCVDGYHDALNAFRQFKDGKGQPLWNESVIDQGVLIICPAADEKQWTRALESKIQVLGINAAGVEHAGSSEVAAAGVTNIIQDTNRNVTLWPTQRVSTNEAYILLKGTPVKPFFVMNRRALRRRDSLGSMNNSDRTRTTGMEYVQWDLRQGAGINLPYGCIKLA